MTILTEITFFDAAVVALILGSVERFVLPRLPASMVGPEGWLIRA